MASEQLFDRSQSSRASSICLWRFLDGKAGHRNQVFGLTDALGRITSVDCQDIDVSTALCGMKSLFPGRIRSLSSLRRPSLLIGAGHTTHIPLLAARHHFGGKATILMKPSLPLSLFDLCLIPAADNLKRIPHNVIITEGAVNRVQPGKTLSPQKGLVLVGGPSSHFGWSDEMVLNQIKSVIEGNPEIDWTLTTSRRTPLSFMSIWDRSGCAGRMLPVDQTNPDWLPTQLSSAGTVWVTNDSVSMIYEALTSGAAVGVLTLPKTRKSRVTNGIDSLIARHLVTPFSSLQSPFILPRPCQQIDEANRCARLLADRFFSQSTADILQPKHAA